MFHFSNIPCGFSPAVYSCLAIDPLSRALQAVHVQLLSRAMLSSIWLLVFPMTPIKPHDGLQRSLHFFPRRMTSQQLFEIPAMAKVVACDDAMALTRRLQFLGLS